MRLLASVAAAVLLAGCGGGGSGSLAPSAATSTTTTTAAVPPPKSGPTATPANANRTPVAVGNLTIKAPAGFHRAKMNGNVRRPGYVNPGAYYLDVWVINGSSATHVVDSSVSGSVVNGGNNGITTLNIPLFSTSGNQVVAYEADVPFGSYGNLLALGEADVGSITAGSSPDIALTMQMHAGYIGVMGDPDNGKNDAAIGGTYTTYNGGCLTPMTISPLYFFVADATGGFVDAGGVGGITLPTVVKTVSDVSSPANTLGQNPGVAGGYNITVNDPGLSGVTVTLRTNDPAYPIGYGVVNNNGSYPGFSTMYNNTYDVNLSYYLYYALYQEISNTPQGGLTNAIDILPRNLC